MISPRVRSELPLIVASLFIAMVIWLIAKQADYEPAHLQAPLKLNNVPSYVDAEAQPGKVGIMVHYPKTLSNLIVEKNFSVPINIDEIFDMKPEQWDAQNPVKEKEYRLTPADVKIDLDPTVQVISVDPDVVMVRAQLRTVAASVEVRTVGELPGGLMLMGKPQAEPPKILLAGPPEALAKLAASNNTVKTEPVDLSAMHTSGQLSRRLVLPDPNLFLLGRRMVTVNVAVTERPVRQTLSGVPISLVTFAPNLKANIDPPTAAVVLEGPASALKAITAGDIEFTAIRELVERPGRVYDVGLVARLKSTVKAELAKQVKIVETKPSRISVEFVPVDKQNK